MCKVGKNWNCTEWPQTELEQFKSQKNSTDTKYLPPRPKIWSISLYNYPFRDKTCTRSVKIRNALNEPEGNPCSTLSESVFVSVSEVSESVFELGTSSPATAACAVPTACTTINVL